MDEALDILLGMVEQHCEDRDKPWHLFSGFIGINATALRFLGKHGKVKILADNGARVVEAELIKVTESAAL